MDQSISNIFHVVLETNNTAKDPAKVPLVDSPVRLSSQPPSKHPEEVVVKYDNMLAARFQVSSEESDTHKRHIYVRSYKIVC